MERELNGQVKSAGEQRVDSALGGEAAGRFAGIWNRYYARVFVFCRLMGSREPEDDVQEIFFKVYRALPRYVSRGRTSSWIYTIARHHLADRARRSRLRTERAWGNMNEFPDQADLSGPNGGAAELFLDLLDGTDRCIAYLRVHEKMKYREIAQTIGIPLGTVKYRVSEIRSRYREFRRSYP